MKKTLLTLCAIIALSSILPTLSHSQNLEEIKARARAEARQEMGLDKPVQQKKTGMEIPLSAGQELLMKLALFAMGAALIPAVIAKVKGRSFVAWWTLGTLCFPVVLIAAVYMRKIKVPETSCQKPEDKTRGHES
jgi:hypothetical protein